MSVIIFIVGFYVGAMVGISLLALIVTSNRGDNQDE